VNPLPTATVSGTTEVCRNGISPGVEFAGADGSSPYIFTYSINNGPNFTAGTTAGSDSIIVLVPTSVADTLVYILISVQDGSSTACSQLQSDTATVIVNPLPVADFSPTEVCFDTPVQFTDLSTVSNDSVTAWDWNFGQEGTSTQENPVFTYIGFGNFVASLIVTSSNGCKDTASELVVVHPLPVPDFYADGVCDGTTTQFNDLSTIVGPDLLNTWSWDFGDNASAGVQEPSHLYSTAGNYSVQLTVTSSFGCTDSITKIVKVHPNPQLAFMAGDTVGCEPLCVLFQDVSQIQSGVISNWLWDTGDGSPMSTASEFEHCYENNLLTTVDYSVTLTAVSDSGCTSMLNKLNLITVYPKPEADFVARPLTTTILNPVITVSDSAVGATTWTWDFGDGTSDASQNPPAHEYGDTGHFTITQIVTTGYGCRDTATELVIVEPDFAFYVPNAFTPDGDGINDSFTGKGVFIIEYEMWIYDRWGNMVYYTDDMDLPWDGKANGGKDMAQRDVYVYVIKLKDIFTNSHKYRGTVTLVR
jgi:gliding motility-associated-like protein